MSTFENDTNCGKNSLLLSILRETDNKSRKIRVSTAKMNKTASVLSSGVLGPSAGS